MVLCEKSLSEFSSNLYVLRPPESGKTVFTKMSVFEKNFMKKSKISILVSDNVHESLLIMLITFFD